MYLIQQFESFLAVFLISQVEDMCVRGSPDLLLTLITLGLIQASPLLQTYAVVAEVSSENLIIV